MLVSVHGECTVVVHSELSSTALFNDAMCDSAIIRCRQPDRILLKAREEASQSGLGVNGQGVRAPQFSQCVVSH